MRTVKRNPFLSGVCAILGGVFLWTGAASADVTSDRSAGLLVFPKLLYSSARDTTLSPLLKPVGATIDTEIQITNTSTDPVQLRCFYVNANSHCSNDPTRVCGTTADCQESPGPGGLCFDGWIEIDFQVQLSPRQPLIWKLSDGIQTLLPPGGGSIPSANEDPFQGELKCVQVGPDDAPIAANDIKGEATIITASSSAIDARAYNAEGVQAITNDGDNTLVLGGPDPEYNGCPNVLILNHFFDDSVDPIDGDYLKTHLTLVPCSENFELQDVALFDTTVQFLIFNEFEQRFSASRNLRCFKEYELCALGTKLDRPYSVVVDPQSGLPSTDARAYSCQRSVFSAVVNGTLAGQTRIRGVADPNAVGHGNGVIGVAEEFYRTDAHNLASTRATDAFNLHQAGDRTAPDIIQLP